MTGDRTNVVVTEEAIGTTGTTETTETTGIIGTATTTKTATAGTVVTAETTAAIVVIAIVTTAGAEAVVGMTEIERETSHPTTKVVMEIKVIKVTEVTAGSVEMTGMAGGTVMGEEEMTEEDEKIMTAVATSVMTTHHVNPRR